MSGVQSTYPFPTSLETEPPRAEGSKVASFFLNWASIYAGNASQAYATTVNLLAQFNSGQFTTVQAVYIDNSTNFYPVYVTAADTGQTVQCGPFSQGMFPLIGSAAAQFNVALSVVAFPSGNLIPVGTTRLFFLNTPQKPYVSQELGLGTNFQTVNGVANTWSSTIQILPGLGPNQHYAISAFSLSVGTGDAGSGGNGFAAVTPVEFRLVDGASTFYPWVDSTVAQTGAIEYYSKQTVFPQPSMQLTAGNALNLMATAYPPTFGYFLTWQITYAVVTIQ